jgi:hypothetical protein
VVPLHALNSQFSVAKPLFTQFTDNVSQLKVKFTTSGVCENSSGQAGQGKKLDDKCNSSSGGGGGIGYLKAPDSVKKFEEEFLKRRSVRDNDIIQFEAVEYLCFETDRSIDISIRRTGFCSGEVELKWSTLDVAAGRSYIPQCGEIKFEPGEVRKTFRVEVMYSRNEFSVESLIDVQLEFKHPEKAAFNSTFGGHLYPYIYSYIYMTCV